MVDHNRYEEIITKTLTNYSEIYQDPEDFEIGTNISGIPAVKVIFDGFGLAEELYHEGKSYQLTDDVVMVQNDDWEWEPLDTDDEQYEYVREKLELFQQFANDDGPCNPNMRSFGVFIHRGAVEEDFEFPEHDMTPWCLIHRPAEEVWINVWHDIENGTFEISMLEDRIDNTVSGHLTADEVMNILEKIWEYNGMGEEVETTTLNPSAAWPFPSGAKTAPLNPNAAWPFPLATPSEVKQPQQTKTEIVEMVKFTDDNPAVKALNAEVLKRGLPKEVGAYGRISETCNFQKDGVEIVTTTNGLKGWIYVNRDHNDYEDEPSYQDTDTLLAVIEGFISNNVSDTELEIEVAGESKTISLIYDEAEGESWKYHCHIDEDDLFDMIREAYAEDSEDEDFEPEGCINDFLWDHCEEVGGETKYDLGYGVAHIEFDDGARMSFSLNNGQLVGDINIPCQNITSPR